MGFICKETKFVRKLKIKRYRWLATRLQLQLCYSLRFVVPEIFLRVVEVSSNILYSVIPRTTIREQCYIVASSTNLSTRSRPKIRRRRRCSHSTLENLPIFIVSPLLEKLLPQPLFYFHRSCIERILEIEVSIVGKVQKNLEHQFVQLADPSPN